MSLWLTITGNSTLPISPSNNFWDHLNNQAGGGDITLLEVVGINVLSDSREYIVEIDETEHGIMLESDHVIQLEPDETSVTKESDTEVTT